MYILNEALMTGTTISEIKSTAVVADTFEEAIQKVKIYIGKEKIKLLYNEYKTETIWTFGIKQEQNLYSVSAIMKNVKLTVIK